MVARRRALAVPLLVAAALAAPPAGGQAPRGVEARAAWRFVAGGKIRYPPAVSTDGVIYVASDDRLLHALDAQGRELWRAPLGARPAGWPVVADDGSILVVTVDRLITVLGAQGRVRWSAALDQVAAYAPALGRDGDLYVALEGASLAGLDHRGQTRWSIRLGSPALGPPTVSADGSVYLCTEDRILHAYDRFGREIWSAALPGPASTAALGADGTVYVSVFGVRAYTRDGRPRWDFPIPSPTTDPVVGRDGAGRETVVVGSRDGKLHRIGADGQRRDEIQLPAAVLRTPGVRADGAVVALTADGLKRVYPDGRQAGMAWVAVGQAATSPVLAPSGLVLVGSEDWVLTAADFGDSLPVAARLPDPPWPQARLDGRNTGRAGRPTAASTPQVLRELAFSTLGSNKERVLEDIAAHLEGDRYLSLSVADMEDLLSHLAQDHPSGPADNPVLRSRACMLLGELGTPGARRTLLGLMERDPRREVQSSAAAALGRVGYDADGEVGRALARLARRYPEDLGLLGVVVRALADVAASSGPEVGQGEARASARAERLESRPAWAALVDIAVGSYPERVRAEAREALRRLGVRPWRGGTE